MKKITVTCTWRTTHEVEVPDDFTGAPHLGDFPADVLEELRSDDPSAELTDWEVRGE